MVVWLATAATQTALAGVLGAQTLMAPVVSPVGWQHVLPEAPEPQPAALQKVALRRESEGSTLFYPGQTVGSSQSQVVAKGPQAAAAGSISGVVTDVDGALVNGAQVTLTAGVGGTLGSAITENDGRYEFEGVAAGTFKMIATAPGMSTATQDGTLDAGGSFEARPFVLSATAMAEVSAMSVHDQAEQEIKVEEHQRLVGFVPNFYVAYNWDAAPLSAKQKFKLAARNSIDPANQLINAAVAGYQYYENDFNGYGRGVGGYFDRFGANEGDLVTGTFVGGAILPVLLHQDPRYFYKGTGTVWSRLEYALESAVMCRSDSGKWEPNYSSIGGDLAAGAIANTYYPASDRDGVKLTIEQGFLGAAFDGIGNVVQEFLFKRVTPHSPVYSSTTPQP